MTAYKAVIFDFGGVLTTPPGAGMRVYCEANGVPWEKLRTLFAPPEGAWSRFERNAISQAEFVAAFAAEGATLGFSVDGGAFLDAFLGGLTVREDMVAVVQALRGSYRLGCITNNVQVAARPRHALFDELFDIVVESSKVGMRKPDPAIYRLACELLNVAPAEAVFLDDFGVNLKAAQELGMGTVKVDESQSAIDELERLLGITLPRAGRDATAAG